MRRPPWQPCWRPPPAACQNGWARCACGQTLSPWGCQEVTTGSSQQAILAGSTSPESHSQSARSLRTTTTALSSPDETVQQRRHSFRKPCMLDLTKASTFIKYNACMHVHSHAVHPQGSAARDALCRQSKHQEQRPTKPTCSFAISCLVQHKQRMSAEENCAHQTLRLASGRVAGSN